ncbi:MAG: Fur family transcriptional regulator [Desulfobulbaceae bacterium]
MMSDQQTIPHLHAQLVNSCRAAGLKLTPQRLEILNELAAAEDHPSAETIHRRLLPRMPSLSLDTVYRTLATFEKYGLIARIDSMESQARYELAAEEHHHVVCRKCGRITDFQWHRFDETSLPPEIRHWGSISKKNATLYGVCRECEESGTQR